MRMRQAVIGGSSAVVLGTLMFAGFAAAQAAGAGQAAPAAQPARGRATAAAPAAARQVHANLNQLMRGVLYPASNVIFAAQGDDPATIKPDKEPSTSPNPLTSTYGGWAAVENAGLTIAESANLLTIPGRVCENGKPAPSGNADWAKFVAGLRTAGMTTYKAARAKNQDQILEAADAIATACADCHDVYREKPNPTARCTK
jgi:hypothetical protein